MSYFSWAYYGKARLMQNRGKWRPLLFVITTLAIRIWGHEVSFMCLKCRECKLDNWITIIRYSLLFCPNYSLFILNFFRDNFIIHFFFQLVFISVFLFRYFLYANYVTKEVNPFTAKCGQRQISAKFPHFIF